MKWQFGHASLRRLIDASVVGLHPERAAAAPLFMVLDAGVCYAALAGAATLTSSQLAGFIVTAIMSYWFMVRPRAAAAGAARREVYPSLVAVTLLALFLRIGVIALVVQRLAMPAYAAVLLAVIASGFVTYVGYGLCVPQRTQGLRLDTRWRSLVIAVVGYAFVLRLVYSAQIELMPEEAYYWNYSRHLDIGYLDHPPFVAWLIRLGTTLFGDTEFGVRFAALGCGVAVSWFVFRLTRNVFGEPSALLALIFAQVLPFFFLSGLLMTPDAPLTAAWAASLYFFERALVAGRRRAWLGVGVAMGLGMLSKYTIGLLGLGAFMFMVVDPTSRRWFRRWEPYVAFLIAAVLFGPVIVWNGQHEWASFAFQTSRRLAERPRFSLHKLLGAAMVLLTPTGLVAAWAAFRQGMPQPGPAARTVTCRVTDGLTDGATDGLTHGATPARAWRLLQWSLLTPLIVFVCFSLRHEIKLDWTGAPWLAALPVMAYAIVETGLPASRGLRWVRAALAPTLVVMLLLYGAGFYYLARGIPGTSSANKYMELIPFGWRDMGRQVDDIADDVRTRYGANSLVIGMDRYAIASELAFYSKDQTTAVARTSSAHLFDDMGLMYEQWFPAGLQAGRTLVLVAWDADAISDARLEKHAGGLGPVREGVLTRNGSFVRRYYYRVVHGYRAS